MSDTPTAEPSSPGDDRHILRVWAVCSHGRDGERCCWDCYKEHAAQATAPLEHTIAYTLGRLNGPSVQGGFPEDPQAALLTDVDAVMDRLEQRIAELEREVERLQATLSTCDQIIRDHGAGLVDGINKLGQMVANTRADALEEAAKVCDRYDRIDLAAAIRELKNSGSADGT